MKFEVVKNKFYRDGQEIKIISGAVHYFRNMPDRWVDIFQKMRALGCNCVETYCAWNMHEKKECEFSFEGILDIAKFIKTAEKEGLMVIVRPGPYICAEWEFGGLPWWVQTYENMEIRCANEQCPIKSARWQWRNCLAIYRILFPSLSKFLEPPIPTGKIIT